MEWRCIATSATRLTIITRIDMALLSETQYLEKLQRIFKNVPFAKIKWAVRRFSNESEQNEYLRKLNQRL